MSLLDRLKADAAAALKAGDRERVGALRLVASELQNAHKEAPQEEAGDQAVLQRERKRRLEAAGAYRDAGREDRAGAEEREARIIEEYLPEQLSDDELHAIVASAVAEAGASSPREMGSVMSLVMPRVGGRAEGRRVSAAVKEALGS